MNAARQRRLELKKRIATQRKQRHEEIQKDFEAAAKLRCRHKILITKPCPECDANFKALFDEYSRLPDVMEKRLRHGLGLDQMRRAFVFMKMETSYGPKIVSIWLSTHHPTQQIQDMRENGFWASDHGYLTYFCGDQITEVCFDNE